MSGTWGHYNPRVRWGKDQYHGHSRYRTASGSQGHHGQSVDEEEEEAEVDTPGALAVMDGLLDVIVFICLCFCCVCKYVMYVNLHKCM